MYKINKSKELFLFQVNMVQSGHTAPLKVFHNLSMLIYGVFTFEIIDSAIDSWPALDVGIRSLDWPQCSSGKLST